MRFSQAPKPDYDAHIPTQRVCVCELNATGMTGNGRKGGGGTQIVPTETTERFRRRSMVAGFNELCAGGGGDRNTLRNHPQIRSQLFP